MVPVDAALLLSRRRAPRRIWQGLGEPRAWLTGGSVRDSLLGRESRDFDFVVDDDLPGCREAAVRLARSLGTRAHRLGRPPRAVWRIETSRLKVELWPLDARTPDDDARRRDFTINAMLFRLPHGPLIDPTGGLHDIDNRVLRTVARSNLLDDPVRLLRAPRFLAQLDDFSLDPDTGAWIAEAAPRLRTAPRERVGHELINLLDAPNASGGWRHAAQLGLIDHAMPGEAASCRHLDEAEAALRRLQPDGGHPVPAALRTGGAAARLGVLLLAWEAPDDALLSPYAWTRRRRQQAVAAATLVREALTASSGPVSRRKEIIHVAGFGFPAVLTLAAAWDPTPSRRWRTWWRLWRARGQDLLDPPPLLSAAEVASFLGCEEGPALGRALSIIQKAQVHGRIRSRTGAERILGELRREYARFDRKEG